MKTARLVTKKFLPTNSKFLTEIFLVENEMGEKKNKRSTFEGN